MAIWISYWVLLVADPHVKVGVGLALKDAEVGVSKAGTPGMAGGVAHRPVLANRTERNRVSRV